jgi:AraC-like DNA-binding protein
LLWRRFLLAWEIVMNGGSLSMAAHSAGFADAAHLTRTSHSMFGFPPSALQLGTAAGIGAERERMPRLQQRRLNASSPDAAIMVRAVSSTAARRLPW